VPAYRGIRNYRFLYVEHRTTGETELYDLQKDPFELQSEHANPAYASLKRLLAGRLHNLVSCAGASCRSRPAAALRTTRHGCAVTANVVGRGIRSVGFSLNRHGLRSDTRAPFRANVVVRGSGLLRARIVFGGDRLLSLDRPVVGC
jgi:hypothetical protein